MSGILLEYPRQDLLRIKELFYEHHGYLRIKELKLYGLKLTDIRQLQEKDIIKRIDAGLFHWEGTTEFALLSDVQKIVPDGVFSLLSALYYHGLIAKHPSICYIAVPLKHEKYILPNYPKIQLLPMANHYWDFGQIEIEIEENTVRLFDKEKTLCECLRYRNQINEVQIIEAFRNYSNLPDKNEELIWQYGLRMRMKLLVKRYMNKYL